MKTRRLEKWIKGVSNHRRIEILDLLQRKPKLSLINISHELKVNFKTIGEHVRRLHIAELVSKHNLARDVEHELTKRGRHVLTFLRTLEEKEKYFTE